MQQPLSLLLAQHSAAIQELRGRVADGSDFLDDVFLLRYILSHKSAQNAVDPLRRTIEWRQVNASTIAEVRRTGLPPFNERISKWIVAQVHKEGYDGSPLYVMRCGVSNLRRLAEEATTMEIAVWLLFQKELIFAHCDAETRRRGRIVNCVTVLDMNNFQMKGADMRFFQSISLSSRQGEDFFPQLTGQTVIVNLPRVVNWVFHFSKRLLSHRAQEKIAICPGGKRAEGILACPYASRMFDPENVPSFLGGECECHHRGGCIQDVSNNKIDMITDEFRKHHISPRGDEEGAAAAAAASRKNEEDENEDEEGSEDYASLDAMEDDEDERASQDEQQKQLGAAAVVQPLVPPAEVGFEGLVDFVGGGIGSMMMRVMTFNLGHSKHATCPDDSWLARRSDLAQYVSLHVQPAVLAVQDVTCSEIQELERQLPQYLLTGRGCGFEPFDGDCCAIFFRRDLFALHQVGTFWLSEMPDSPGSVHPSASAPRIVHWACLQLRGSAKPFFVFSVLFDTASPEARLFSAQLLLRYVKEIAGVYPAVVLGTLAANPSEQCYSLLSSSFLRDTALPTASAPVNNMNGDNAAAGEEGGGSAQQQPNKIQLPSSFHPRAAASPQGQHAPTYTGFFNEAAETSDYIFASGFAVQRSLVLTDRRPNGRNYSSHRAVCTDCVMTV